jgi:hypothetical protein
MSRLSICALAGALALAGFTLGKPKYHPMDATESARSLQDPQTSEIEASMDLDAKLRVVKQIVSRKQELAKKLITGGIDLETAGRQFLEVEQHMPGRNRRIIQACNPSQSDLERCSRQLMDLALDEASRTLHTDAQLKTRLQSEFKELLSKEQCGEK